MYEYINSESKMSGEIKIDYSIEELVKFLDTQPTALKFRKESKITLPILKKNWKIEWSDPDNYYDPECDDSYSYHSNRRTEFRCSQCNQKFRDSVFSDTNNCKTVYCERCYLLKN
jgi:hypothetical protein